MWLVYFVKFHLTVIWGNKWHMQTCNRMIFNPTLVKISNIIFMKNWRNNIRNYHITRSYYATDVKNAWRKTKLSAYVRRTYCCSLLQKEMTVLFRHVTTYQVYIHFRLGGSYVFESWLQSAACPASGVFTCYTKYEKWIEVRFAWARTALTEQNCSQELRKSAYFSVNQLYKKI
jgi:hypothetical protein